MLTHTDTHTDKGVTKLTIPSLVEVDLIEHKRLQKQSSSQQL